MSSASAAARASFLSTSTISRPTPRITRAYAAVAPTSPLPTTPTFMRSSPAGVGVPAAHAVASPFCLANSAFVGRR